MERKWGYGGRMNVERIADSPKGGRRCNQVALGCDRGQL